MNKDAPALVLIPGFMLDESLWDDMLQAMPSHFNIYKASLKNGKNIDEIVENIIKTLPEKFILIGFSLGGYIARALINQYPEKVSALILIATSLRADTEIQHQQKLALLNSIHPENFKGLSTKSITQSLHPEHVNHMMINRIQEMGQHLGYETFIHLSSLNRRHISTHTILCPTLIIYGAQDLLRSKNEALEIVDLIPNSQMIGINNTGHMIPIEQPEILAKTILWWLDHIFYKI